SSEGEGRKPALLSRTTEPVMEMAARPKRGDTEDDLLEFQSQFLSSRNNPSAAVVRVRKDGSHDELAEETHTGDKRTESTMQRDIVDLQGLPQSLQASFGDFDPPKKKSKFREKRMAKTKEKVSHKLSNTIFSTISVLLTAFYTIDMEPAFDGNQLEDAAELLERHDRHISTVLTEIRERDIQRSGVLMPTRVVHKGFPEALHRGNIAEVNIENQKNDNNQGKISLFAQHFKASNPDAFGLPQITPPQDLLVSVKHHKSAINIDHQTSQGSSFRPSNLVSGEGLMSPTSGHQHSAATREAERIHQENVERMSAFTQEEIMQEQERLKKSLDPSLLAFLRSRHQKKLSQTQNAAQEQENMEIEEIKPVSSTDPETKIMSDLYQTKQSSQGNNSMDVEMDIAACDNNKVTSKHVHFDDNIKVIKQEETAREVNIEIKELSEMAATQKWVNMGTIEEEKLEWMKDCQTPSAVKKESGNQARFAFDGSLITRGADIPVNVGLHHHGNEPDAAGYTLEELFVLSRSNFLQQRVVALQTLARIVTQDTQGSFINLLQSSVLSTLLDAGIIFLLRWALDDTVDAAMAVAVQCLSSVLVVPRDQEYADRVCDWHHGQEFPSLQPGNDEKKEDKTDDEDENRKQETDTEIVKKDVIKISKYGLMSYILCYTSLHPRDIQLTYNDGMDLCIESIRLWTVCISYGLACDQFRIVMSFVLHPCVIYLHHSTLSYHHRSPSFSPVDSLEDIEDLVSTILLPVINSAFMGFLMKSLSNMSVTSSSILLTRGITSIPDYGTLPCNTQPGMTAPTEPLPHGPAATFMTSFTRLCCSVINVHKGIANKFLPFVTREEMIEYVTRISTTQEVLCQSFFGRVEHHLQYFVVKLFYMVVRSVDCNDLTTPLSVYHTAALVVFSHLRSGDEYYAHDLMSTVLFNPNFYPEATNHETTCVARELSEMNIRSQGTPTAPQLLTKENRSYSQKELLCEAHKNLLAIRSTYMGSFGKVRHALAASRGRSLHQPYDIQSLLLPSSSGPFLPADWMFVPVVDLHNQTLSAEMKGRGVDEVPHAMISTVTCTLQLILMLEEWRPVSLASVTMVAKITRLMCIFLTGSDLFLDRMVHHYVRSLLLIYTRPSCLSRLDFSGNVAGLSSFYDLYTSSLSHYSAVSFGDPLFASFLVLPLAQRQHIKFRHALWDEYVGTIRAVSFPVNQVPIPLDHFLYPIEQDDILLYLYLRALSNQEARPRWCPFFYLIAIHHVNAFIYQRINPKDVRKDLLYYYKPLPDSSSDKAFEVFTSLPPDREILLRNRQDFEGCKKLYENMSS
ncbi:hypothetical protein QZH41_019009, partial [Actinostola sp. cb2023]